MNLTSWIVLVACLTFGLIAAWLAWLTFAWYCNKNYQERLHRRLMKVRRKMGISEEEAIKAFIRATTPPPPVPPHPLWATAGGQLIMENRTTEANSDAPTQDSTTAGILESSRSGRRITQIYHAELASESAERLAALMAGDPIHVQDVPETGSTSAKPES